MTSEQPSTADDRAPATPHTRPRPSKWWALIVLAVGLAYFLAWDVWGIVAGVFLHRESPYMTGLLVAPQLPVEEVFFLLFLSYLTMVLFTGAVRILEHRAGRAGRVDRAAHAAGGRRTGRDA